jgi:putative ABC transport system permease protein
LAGSGMLVAEPNTTPYIAVQLGGALIATAGIVVLLPGLISFLARTAHRLGLSARLALRDAARHRHRTAPTVAAIAIVVAGSTAVAFGAGGAARADELRYLPSLPGDVLRIDVDRQGQTAAQIDEVLGAAERAAAGALPDARIVRATEATTESTYDGVTTLDTVWVAAGSDCAECGYAGSVSMAVADPELMELVTGSAPDQATLDALAAGRVVVFEQPYIRAGDEVVIDIYPIDGEPQRTRIPAHLAERPGAYSMLPGAFASAATLTAHGLTPMDTISYIHFGDATPEQLDAALGAVEAAGAWPAIELPPDDGTDPAVLALTAGAAFVTLVGVAIAVSLAAAEGRADLATLAAVGAPPRRRRSLAGAQALVVGGLGVLIGLVLGVYFAYLVWPALGAPEFIWAWDSLVLTGVAVPALAVVVAVVFTPSRLPMIRRVE